MQLVLVKWRDAQAEVDWQKAEDARAAKPEVYSLGWLIAEQDGVIIIAADLAPGDRGVDTNRRLEVPKGMVEKIVKVQLRTKKGPLELMAKKKKPMKPKSKTGY